LSAEADAAWSVAALLPAAWLLMLGAGLVLGMRRWFDPLPVRVLAVCGLLLAVLFAPVLVGGKVMLPLGNLRHYPPFAGLPPFSPPTPDMMGDLVHEQHPWQVQVREALRSGRWPLWNENAGAGMPLLADPQTQVLQPLVLVTLPLPALQAYAVTGALRVLLVLTGSFLLLRRWALGEAAALLGAVSAALGGWLLWLGWPIANAVAWLPWVLYALARCDQMGGRRDAALLAVTLAGLLLGGHPETVLYGLLVTALIGVAVLRRRGREGAARTPFLRRTLLAAAVAGAVAMPALLPAQGYLPLTDRARAVRHAIGSRPWNELAAGVVHGLTDAASLAEWGRRAEGRLVPLLAPRAHGDFDSFWGDGNVIEAASGFAGTVTGLLALLSLAPARRRFGWERPMMGLAAVSLLLIAQPEGWRPLLGKLPVVGLSAIHHQHRLILVVGFAAACLAACELERWRAGERRRSVLVLGAVLLAGLLAAAYLAHPRPGTEGLVAAPEAAHLARQLAALALAVVALLALGAPGTRERTTRGWLPWALVVVAVAELVLLHREAVPRAPRRVAFPQTPAMRFVADRLDGGRLVGMGAVLPANFAQAYDLADVRVQGPSRPSPYVHLLETLRVPGVNRLGRMYRLAGPAHPLWDLLGVRYVLSRPQLRLALPAAHRDEAICVWERPSWLPRLFLPRETEARRGRAWPDWLASNPDFARRALVEAGPGERARRRWRARRPAEGRLELSLAEPEWMRARSSAPERRLLASSVLALPGWSVLIDRRPVALALTNGIFVGAWLPPGEHRVELLYRPVSWLAGGLLAAAGAALALSLVVPPPRPPARRREIAP
jgi:hypothetical protein